MRARRSAKFAEYLSTYAILERIAIHPTTLIEKRDAAVGVGVYVRDACDAGTSLLAVPSKRFCTNSVLSKVGLKTRFCSPWPSAAASTAPQTTATQTCDDVGDGLVAYLTGSSQWPELAWRLALEQHRSVSHLWGWLQSLPSAEEMAERKEAAERQCRVHHTMLLPYYLKGRRRIRDEVASAHAQLRPHNILPPLEQFAWAVDVLVSRGQSVPTAWPSTSSVEQRSRSTTTTDDGDEDGGDDDDSLAHASLECGVVPFLDLVNAADGAGRTANATVEVATSLEALPQFLKDDLMANAEARGHGSGGGESALAQLEELLKTHYYLCLTLHTPLRASAEVILDWQVPVVTTGVLTPDEDAVVSRLLKYMF
ncbi:hypothetical protein NESM_000522500 [Novymonas esmeraldas]|uniref:Uncharacterized protein n=1 Tax=Novymonas esmeraldas TaxID=1808958 RepID=A0AAW0ENX4_9TRYP